MPTTPMIAAVPVIQFALFIFASANRTLSCNSAARSFLRRPRMTGGITE